jgi:hypothetical protein
MIRQQFQQIIKDYDRGLISRAFAVYGLTVLLLETAEEGLAPSDVAFMLGHHPALIQRSEALH